MAKVLSVVNLKGGVGKTAIAVNFSAYCGLHGMKTLLVDLDPQTNATFSCIEVEAWERHAQERGTIANLFGFRSQAFGESTPCSANDIIIHQVFTGVDLIPSHLDLFTIDLDLAGATGREFRLKRAIEPLTHEYDVIVCDCPPNLTIPTQNGLAASSHYLVPISPDFLSGLGVGILLNRVRGFCADLLGHQLRLAGMVISRVGRPALHRSQTVAALRERFGRDVLNTEIRERVSVSESAAANRSIFASGNPDAIREFSSMSKEVLHVLNEVS
jgi:chromosome partitioning protein